MRIGTLGMTFTALLSSLPLLACNDSRVPRDAEASGPDSVIVAGALGARLDTVARALADSGFWGSVLVATDTGVLLAKGYGWADSARGVANGPGTIYDIGSITKPLTAVLVLALEAEGRLKRHGTLPQFVRNVPADRVGITIHQLLTHTSGLPEYSGRDPEPIDREELVRRALAAPLESPPGARYRYSNLGFSLLAAIVEEVSGETYEDALRRRVLAPSGMRSTGYASIGEDERQRIAHRYSGGEDTGINPTRVWGGGGPGWNLVGNGGLHSTVWDLYRWTQALGRGGLLPADQLSAQLTPHVCMGLSDNAECRDHYGYGWHISTQPSGERVLLHNGSDGAYYAEIRRYTGSRITIIVASNRQGDIAGRAASRLAAHAVRDPRPAPATQR